MNPYLTAAALAVAVILVFVLYVIRELRKTAEFIAKKFLFPMILGAFGGSMIRRPPPYRIAGQAVWLRAVELRCQA